jgi:hypothetical protein
MRDVAALQSIAARLSEIAGDCFDLRAAERLRILAQELQASNDAQTITSRESDKDGERAM